MISLCSVSFTIPNKGDISYYNTYLLSSLESSPSNVSRYFQVYFVVSLRSVNNILYQPPRPPPKKTNIPQHLPCSEPSISARYFPLPFFLVYRVESLCSVTITSIKRKTRKKSPLNPHLAASLQSPPGSVSEAASPCGRADGAP